MQNRAGAIRGVFSGSFGDFLGFCRNIDVGSRGEDSWPMESENGFFRFLQMLFRKKKNAVKFWSSKLLAQVGLEIDAVKMQRFVKSTI